jgi:DNA-binding transcriptional MerR regulator
VTETDDTDAAPRVGKSAAAFRTTGEVAEELGLQAHILRFWETRFPQVKPLRRGGGRRYYRPEDVDLLRRIRQCLYQEGYTIRGVQRLLRDRESGGLEPEPSAGATQTTLFALTPEIRPEGAPARTELSRPALRAALDDVRRELLEIRALLDRLRQG